MKKFIISAILGLFCAGAGWAAEGDLVFEDVAVSSIAVRNLTVSSTTETMASYNNKENTEADGISWFQIDVYNVASSTIAFAVNESTATAPSSLSCSNKAYIGQGTESSPEAKTFKLLKGFYLWLLDCNETESGVDVGIVEYGR